jgi:hypothetical protein
MTNFAENASKVSGPKERYEDFGFNHLSEEQKCVYAETNTNCMLVKYLSYSSVIKERILEINCGM